MRCRNVIFATKFGFIIPVGRRPDWGFQGLKYFKFEKEHPQGRKKSARSVMVNVLKTGTINPTLNNYNNLMSTLDHEKFHELDDAKGVPIDFQTHSQVYINQAKDQHYKSASQEFQIGQAGSLGQHLLNLNQDPTVQPSVITNLADEFNKTNSAGLSLDLDLSGKGGYIIYDKDGNALSKLTLFEKIDKSSE